MPFTTSPDAFTWGNLNNTWAGLYSDWLGDYALTPIIELGAFTGFTLDDGILGILDEGVLDGDISYVDVTSELISFGSNRGRSRDLERTNAGQLGAEFRNEARQFDPLNGASSLRPYTVPRKPVRVSVDGLEVFTGLTDDWNYRYSLGGLSVASITSSDAFSLFAREENAGGSAVQQTSGERINEVLDQIAIPWPQLQRDIDTGDTTMVADIIDGNALAYLQKVEQSEAGLIFMTKDGKFGFRGRIFQPTTDAVTFTDNPSGIQYEGIEIVYGTEMLANNVTVTSPAGTATAVNATSEFVYGVTYKDIDTLLIAGQLQGLADYVVAKFGVPEYRVERIRINMRKLTVAQRATVLSLELGDQADVVFTPNNIGQPIALRNRVIGINHELDLDNHFVSFSFEELPFDFFILDDAVFGKLDDDAGVLAF